MKLHITGETQTLEKGIDILSHELNFTRSNNGDPIHIAQQNGPLTIKNDHNQGKITFQEPIHFYRGLGLWIENYQKQQTFDITEEPQFKMNGVMLDASRNAVLTVDGIKDMLRKMAIMGLNTLMVYTEDTYEVDDYPYFGYMRGRYTEKELKLCDEYATHLGIEMIPCIQTLAHLTEALKWNYAIELRDTADILLAGEQKTYDFLEKIIKAASKPFKSNRIHIGMDEAHQLGLGKYLDKHGYEERFSIMNRHLKEVVAITKKLKLNPMIWSDMYFRLGSKRGAYYDLEAEIPEDVIKSIPDAQLVYWDYYHTDEDFYQTFIQKHKQLKSGPIFAGGVWTWNGISPNYGKAIATTEAAMTACKKENVQETFVTMWGDNGAETPWITALPVLQLYAEHAYHKNVTSDHVAERFKFCCDGQYDDFMALNQLDETPGVSENNLHESNPSKLLLWQDLLIGLYDKDMQGLPLNNHYAELTAKLKQAKQANPSWTLLFDFYQQLADVLSIKAEYGINLKEAYDTNDKTTVEHLKNQLADLKTRINSLRKKHRTIWFTLNKPFGWEIIEIRYGGVLARIDTVEHRLHQWLTGNIDTLEELDAERLPFEGPYPMPDGSLGRNLYHRIVTAGNLS